MEVCAANGSQAAAKRRRGFLSIDTVRRERRRPKPRKRQARQHRRRQSGARAPRGHTRQEGMSGNPHCGGCARRFSWATAVGFGVVRTMTTNREAGSIRIMANGFHHSSIPHATMWGRDCKPSPAMRAQLRWRLRRRPCNRFGPMPRSHGHGLSCRRHPDESRRRKSQRAEMTARRVLHSITQRKLRAADLS